MSAALLAVLVAPSHEDRAPGRAHLTPDELRDLQRRDAEAQRADQALVARIRAGDEQAFRELAESYFLVLSRFAGRILHDPALADDIVQDVLSRVWQQRAGWTLERSVKAYLFGAVRNRALNERQHRSVRARRAPELTESLQYSATHQPDIEERLTTNTIVVALQRAVDALPEHRRTALQLRYEEGMTYPAIASVLGVSVKSAEQLVALTVQALRKELRRFR